MLDRSIPIIKMRKITILIAAFMLAVSCATVQEPTLQTGDLVFVGLPMEYSLENDGDTMDSAIVAATGDDELNMIHVAIAEVDENDAVWIIDATIKHGVDRHPLSVFLEDFTLKDGSYPEFVIKRLGDNSNAEQWVENAKKYLGLPYDVAFQPTESAFYCSELVETSYLSEDGTRLFHNAPMNFKNADGEFPVYWEQLFARIDSSIPQDEPGTNPQAMSKETCLVTVEGIDITALK